MFRFLDSLRSLEMTREATSLEMTREEPSLEVKKETALERTETRGNQERSFSH